MFGIDSWNKQSCRKLFSLSSFACPVVCILGAKGGLISSVHAVVGKMAMRYVMQYRAVHEWSGRGSMESYNDGMVRHLGWSLLTLV